MDHADHSPGGTGQPRESQGVQAIPLHAIDVADRTFQFRRDASCEASGSLVQSLEKDGQLAPIKVLVEGTTYRILDGFRRAAAAHALGWQTIDAVVFPPMAAAEARKIAFVANVVRENLSVLEKALAIQLARREGYSKAEMVAMFGISERQIERYFAVPDGVLEWIDGRVITMAHAQVIGEYLATIPRDHLPGLIATIRRRGLSAKALPRWLNARGFTRVTRVKRTRTVGNISPNKVRFYNMELSRFSPAETREHTLDFLRRAIRHIEEFGRTKNGPSVTELENESA